MKKSVCILLMVLVVGVVHTQAKKTKKLVLLSHGLGGAGLLKSDAGYGFSDHITIGAKSYNDKYVGTVRGFFAYWPKDGADNTTQQIGPAILTLPDGKIAYSCERFGVAETAYGVITGGTKRYAGITGNLVVKPTLPEKYKFTIYTLTFNFDKAV